jgi:hypothetical protein
MVPARATFSGNWAVKKQENQDDKGKSGVPRLWLIALGCGPVKVGRSQHARDHDNSNMTFDVAFRITDKLSHSCLYDLETNPLSWFK